MTVSFDEITLTSEEAESLRRTDPRWWFTRVTFANASSPSHPGFERMEANHRMKAGFVEPWMKRVVPEARVLDTFCANGSFTFRAAQMGAAAAIGVDYDAPRIECARYVEALLRKHDYKNVPEFQVGDVYALEDVVRDPFDVTMCFGGLYHIGDPVLVLRKLREATRTDGYLILQTSGILWRPGASATFYIRGDDRTTTGFSSWKAGQGVWKFTWRLVDRMLRHAGFEVEDRTFPPIRLRRRFTWYGALARAV